MDFITIAAIIVVCGLIIVVMGFIAASNMKRKYLASLEQLKKDPANASLREETLKLGRAYIQFATSLNIKEAEFTELSIMNDVQAACAAASQPQSGGTAVKIRCRSCQALNDDSMKFCGQCGATI